MVKFDIYTRSTGFQNSEYLNSIGLKIYDIFKQLKEGGNKYFHRINNITVTSMHRTGNENSAHFENKAIDFYIEPVEYMPYYYGVIHACYPFNINLGIARLHIHVDNSDNHFNRKGIEYPNPETKKIDIIAPAGKNIDYVLEKYNFGFLTYITDLFKFRDITRKLYLTFYKNIDKLPLSYFQELPAPAASNWLFTAAIIAGLVLYYKQKGE